MYYNIFLEQLLIVQFSVFQHIESLQYGLRMRIHSVIIMIIITSMNNSLWKTGSNKIGFIRLSHRQDLSRFCHQINSLTSPTLSNPLRAAIFEAMSFLTLSWNFTKKELVKISLLDDVTDVVSPNRIYNHTETIGLQINIFWHINFYILSMMHWLVRMISGY